MVRKLCVQTAAIAAALIISVGAAWADDAPAAPAASPAVTVAQDAAAPPTEPITLEDCINIVLEGHPKVKISQQQLESGRYATRQAIAGFWPTVDFGASRNHVHIEREVRIGGATVTTTANFISNDFTFNTNWTLFDFGRTYYRVRGLAELEGNLLSGLNAAEQTVVYDVMNAYFGLLGAQSLVEVASETMAVSETHLKQAQAFYDVGVKPRFDVTQAEVEVNDSKLKLIQAEDVVKAARASLNTKLGFSPLAETKVVELPITEKLEGELQSYVDRAIKNHPGLVAQEYSIKSAEAGVKGAYADFLPTISASATQNWNKEDHSDVLSNESFQLTLDVPIFEGFRSWAALGQARANALAAEYRLEDMRRDVTLDVSNNFLAVEDAKARIDALESSVKKAQENLEIAQGRYEAGVGPLIEVTDAQVGLTSAKTDLTKAKYDYHTAYANLLRSVGAPVKGGEGTR